MAPVAAPVAAALLIVLFSLRGPWGLSSILEIAQIFFLSLLPALFFGWPVAVLIAVVFGFPVLKYLQWTNRVSFPHILGLSGFFGVLVFILIAGWGGWNSEMGWFYCTGRGKVEPCSNLDFEGWFYNFMTMGFFLVQGLAVGWVFWLIAYYPRNRFGRAVRYLRGSGC